MDPDPTSIFLIPSHPPFQFHFPLQPKLPSTPANRPLCLRLSYLGPLPELFPLPGMPSTYPFLLLSAYETPTHHLLLCSFLSSHQLDMYNQEVTSPTPEM